MKTTDKKGTEKTGKDRTGGREKIKTDFPLSEKDEVKQAEEKMRRRTKGLL